MAPLVMGFRKINAHMEMGEVTRKSLFPENAYLLSAFDLGAFLDLRLNLVEVGIPEEDPLIVLDDNPALVGLQVDNDTVHTDQNWSYIPAANGNEEYS